MPQQTTTDRRRADRDPPKQTIRHRLSDLAANRRLQLAALGVVVAASLVHAWQCRFIQDDAFISLRYAHNLISGHGLVFNPGEYVEGYTNFLWTLLGAVPLLLDFEPVTFLQLAGMLLFTGSLLLTARLAQQTVGPWAGVVAVLFLGSHYTFAAYASGGLETQLQALLAIAAVLWGLSLAGRGGGSAWALIGWSVLTGAAVLTRLDSVVLVAPTAVALGWVLLRPAISAGEGERAMTMRALALRTTWVAGPAAVIIGGWLAWKLSYYGDILPNTWYAKAATATSYGRGLAFVLEHLRSYHLLALPILLVVARGGELLRGGKRTPRVLVATVLLWIAYIIRVGGGFMEFRFMVAVIPMLAVLLVWGLAGLGASWGRIAVLALVLTGNTTHVQRFSFHPWLQVETVTALDHHVTSTYEDWRGIGQTLGSYFPPSSGVTLAVTAAGAIPFYSQLPAVDMLGLTDAHVAHEGVVFGDRPGHQRIATLDYLQERGVNLVIGHPAVRDDYFLASGPRAQDLDLVCQNLWRWFEIPRTDDPDHATLLAVPLGNRRYLIAIYLVPHPAIDEIIAAEEWQQWPLEVGGSSPAAAVAEAIDPFRRPPFPLPVYRSSQLGLGEVLFHRGDLTSAEAAFASVVDDRGIGGAENRHLNTWAHFWLGRTAQARGERARAIKEYTQAYETEPGNFAARVALAYVYIDLGWCDLARPQLEAALAIAPHDAPARRAVELCRQ